jgi:hypothetical protein
VPRVHAHFFTADGQFGSLDFTGQQVDAGIYTIIEPGTVVIDNGDFRATFHYRFTDHGDTIRLYPIAPDCVCDRPVGRGGGLPRQEVDARELGDPRTHERPRVGVRRRVMASRGRPRPRDLILIRVLRAGLFPLDRTCDLRERWTASDRWEPLGSDGMWTKRGPGTPARGGSGAPPGGPCLARQTPAGCPRQASPARAIALLGGALAGSGPGTSPCIDGLSLVTGMVVPHHRVC